MIPALFRQSLGEKRNKMNKKILGIIIFLVAIASFLGGSFLTQLRLQNKVAGEKTESLPTPSPAVKQAKGVTLEMIKKAFEKSLVKFGDLNSPLLILEISDPSCPFCHVAAGKNGELNKQIDNSRGRQVFTLVSDGGTYLAPVVEIRKLVEEKKASFAYLYFPGHGNGEMGTKALYCAFKGGKYWEVHDKLMTNKGYDLLNNSVRNDRGKAAELADFLKSVFDQKEMKECLESKDFDEQLKIEEDLGGELMVSASGGAGTPGFFINTVFFGGAYNFKEMEPAIKEALQTK